MDGPHDNDNYDRQTRRETPLLAVLRDIIAREGPITTGRYMSLCLSHPEHGYYVSQQAIGRDGDFITAPEISQVFGELIGLWCVVAWQQMGQPAQVRLVEVGPGRGTLMADALRAAARIAAFQSAARIDLVEINPHLQRAQEAALSSAPFPVTWHSDFDEVPDDAPLILVANEYLDTRSVDQVIEDGGTSRPRLIGLDAKGQLQFTGPGGIAADEPNPATVWERPAEPCRLIDALARRVAHPVAGLLIDYGHDTTLAGETLQAVRGHKFEHILTSPGEADLSAHVDFAHFAGICGTLGLDVDGPLPQAEFLGNLGALQRASRLMSANPARAMEIETGMLRLMSPTGMGGHFKVIGVRDPALPPLPGFPDAMA